MMSQKYYLAIAATLLFAASASAQNGANAGMGGPDGDYKSLYELVAGHEKKCDSFNVFLNTGGSFHADENGGAFAGRDLRLEIKGNLGDHLGYRLRYQLNKSFAPLPL
ncbi:MAG: porin, partial [Bacteroidales bacterium]|nr:porin [Bacteroidales bacterium]